MYHRYWALFMKNDTSIYCPIGIVGTVFDKRLGDRGSIPVLVIPKTQKMVLDTFLLNTQYYKGKYSKYYQ